VTEALDLWDHLFGGITGHLCITTGSRQSNGRLAKMQDWFFEWPEQKQKASQFAQRGSENLEVFFVASLLTTRKRTKDCAGPIAALFVDGDGAGEAVPEFLPQPTATVESSPGKRHWYWKLDQAIAPEEAEQLNKRLAYALGADKSGYDATQLLRVPGTRNHKYSGNPRVLLLDIEEYDCWPVSQLEEFIPALPALKPPIISDNDPPVFLSAEALEIWQGEKPQLKDGGEIDKSGSLCKIAYALREAGASVKIIAEALAERDETLDYKKYTGRNDAGTRYLEIAKRAVQTNPVPTLKPRETAPDKTLQLTSYRRVNVKNLVESGGKAGDTEALVHGLLYPGLMTLIGSWVGVGKTSLAMALIAAILKQEPALGLLPPGVLTGPIIYFSELPLKSMAKTLANAAETYAVSLPLLYDNLHIYDIAGDAVNDAAVAKQALAICAGAALVIVDTFDAWLSGNPNETSEVLAAWNLLKNIASSGPAVLVLDHQGKNKPDQNREQTAVAGNSAKQRFGDMVYRLDKSEGADKYNILSPVKDRFGEAIELEIRKNDKGRLIAFAGHSR
jgi:hypothetical protein